MAWREILFLVITGENVWRVILAAHCPYFLIQFVFLYSIRIPLLNPISWYSHAWPAIAKDFLKLREQLGDGSEERQCGKLIDLFVGIVKWSATAAQPLPTCGWHMSGSSTEREEGRGAPRSVYRHQNVSVWYHYKSIQVRRAGGDLSFWWRHSWPDVNKNFNARYRMCLSCTSELQWLADRQGSVAFRGWQAGKRYI